MEIIEETKENYTRLLTAPFSAFERAEFCELNKGKVDELKYLIFNDGKNRFALAAGLRDGVVRLPFSASFSCFSCISKNSKIICCHEAVRALVEWAHRKGCRGIVFSLPPHCYAPAHLTYIYNALWGNGFALKDIEVNFEYLLENFRADDYEMDIDPKARQKLRAARKNGFHFEKTDDLDTVYDVIRRNREYRGFPLHMSLDDVRRTAAVLPADLFLLRDKEGVPAASALIYHVTDSILRVVYWGNTPESENLRPMNLLAFEVFRYYSLSPFKMIDIGHSTDDSVPNFGLCDFKQSVGCVSSPKFIFTRSL